MSNSHEQVDLTKRSESEWRATLLNEGRLAVEELLRGLKLTGYVSAVERGEDAWTIRIDMRTPRSSKSIDLTVDGALLLASRHDKDARRRILRAWRPLLVSGAETRRALRRLRHRARQRLEHSIQRIAHALEETQLERERHRLQEELMALELARGAVDGMSLEDLESLYDRLGSPPPDWITRRERAS